MDYVFRFNGLILLTGMIISGGCSASPKHTAAPVPAAPADVFLQELQPPKSVLYDPFLEDSPPPPKKLGSPPPPPKEPDNIKITLADAEQILSKDLWVKNVLLDRLQDKEDDNGRAGRSEGSRKRADEIHKLNLSTKERRKFQNDQYVYGTDTASTWRWFHRELEQLAETPVQERANIAVFLTDPKYQGKNDKILRANAAILLGRELGRESADKEPATMLTDVLLEVVQDASLRTELRCAAVEMLGKRADVSVETLLPLLEPYKEKETETKDTKTGLAVRKPQNGIPLLWMELLTAAAEKTQPWEEPCFLEPFRARDYDTRLQTAKLWRRCSTACPQKPGKLPEQFLELVKQEPSPAIRAEMIRTLGLWKEPRIFELVGADLHRETLVRNAAMDALVDAQCREAVPAIQQKLNDPVASNRLKAAKTLAAIGVLDGIHKLANDPDAEVRKASAEILGTTDERQPAIAVPTGQVPLKQLESENAAERRKAAMDILQLSETQTFSGDTVQSIVKCCRRETDMFTLTALLNTLKTSDAAAARQTAQTLSDAEVPELRKAFCETLGTIGTVQDLPQLAELMKDANRSVSAASAAAITEILQRQDAETLRRSQEIVRNLTERLKIQNERSGDARTETDIAAILHILNDTNGTETLRRLLHSGDVQTKCYAVRKIGELEDPVFAPELVQLLDNGNGSVRSAALNALPKITGQNIDGQLTTSQKIEHWKQSAVR
ncbi:MAG: hypothetical protein LBN39_10620 [Planctomycetaceae bacterium]|jgi:HEAT repeat protein|nr:hypothetical protein [Planctomycetaceae bacterium]